VQLGETLGGTNYWTNSYSSFTNFIIDTQKPNTPTPVVVGIDGNGWINNWPKFTWTAVTDPDKDGYNSGIDRYVVIVRNERTGLTSYANVGTNLSYSMNPAGFAKVLGVSGDQLKVRIKTIDKAGNYRYSDWIKFKVDVDPPHFRMDEFYTDNMLLNRKKIDIKGLRFYDFGGSGFDRAEFWYRKDGGSWKHVTSLDTTSNPADFVYDLPGEGVYDLKIVAYDKAGNKTESTYNGSLDKSGCAGALEGRYYTGKWNDANLFTSGNYKYFRGVRYDSSPCSTCDSGMGMETGKDDFGVHWRGQVYIPGSGTCSFMVRSVEGASLWINGVKIIDKLGVDTQKKLSQKIVVIIGVGAVGGNIAILLARSGVKKFVFIDYQKLDKSDKIRHIYSNNTNINEYKTEALKNYLKKIDNSISIECINKKLLPTTNLEEIIPYNADLVINSADEPYIGYTSIKLGRYLWNKNIAMYVAGGFDAHSMSTGEFIIPGKTACIDCYINSFTKALKDWKPIYNEYSNEEIEYENIKDIIIGGSGSIVQNSLFSASYATMNIIFYLIGYDNLKERRGEYLPNKGIFSWVNFTKEECEICKR
jgi:molybdopterin/thiamine biosynthesis adenylyltransferase